VHEVLRSPGERLDTATRAFMEPRFGHDFSGVRVHTDPRAAESARAVSALAYTVGQDIVFDTRINSLGSPHGTALLAHELAHVVQQSHTFGSRDNLTIERPWSSAEQEADALSRRVLSGAEVTVRQRTEQAVQCQTTPSQLLRSEDLTRLSVEQLYDRYDRIASTLSVMMVSTSETALLEKDAGDIGIELGRRSALEAGRTFAPASVATMRDFFIRNAKSDSPDSCIGTLNKGVRLLYGDPSQKVGSEVDKTMAKLKAASRAGPGRNVEFEAKGGRVTSGTLYPQKLHESLWSVLLEMAGGDPGWSVFGLSILDGYHSVVLTLDNADPSKPRVYWSDQWSSKGGWKEYNQTELDAEITRLTQSWWAEHPDNRKPNTHSTLWRMGREPPPQKKAGP
jgi:hypothetical protein